MSTQQFVALVPVKPPTVGKSRLGELPGEHRTRLAEAFARDTIAAALATDAVAVVLVVTDDHRLASSLAGAGCEVVPDGVSGDLNASLVQAAAEAHRRWPQLRPIALCADLPSLTPDALSRALAGTPPGPAFVADSAGSGTTLYTAPHGSFAPRFGHASRQSHLESGAVELEAPDEVRQDVDEVGDLGRAMVLGLGAHTARATGRATGDPRGAGGTGHG